MTKAKIVLLRLGLTITAVILGMVAIGYNSAFAWFCFVPFFIAVRGLKPLQAAKYGAFAGAVIGGFVFAGLYRYGLGIIFVISLYAMCSGALFGFAAGCVGQKAFKGAGLLFLPMVWVALEFARTLSPISLPSNLAISQFRNTPLIQIASITGAYGISFIIVLVNCFLYKIARETRKPTFFIATAAILILSPAFSSFLTNMEVVSDEKSIKVAVVQGSIPIELYRAVNKDPRAKEIIRESYFNLTQKVKTKGADLVVWPEGVLGEYAMQEPGIRNRLEAIPKRNNAFFMAGLPSVSSDGAHNTVYVFSPDGNLIGQYDKLHLVPYFEQYKPGTRSPVIDTGLRKFGMAICFESIYPGIIRGLARGGSEIIFILTNDAGFGGSKLVELHAREAVFRAVENRRYVVRAAQSGISMFIDPMGRVLNRSKEFEKTILTGSVKPRSGLTFYARFGDVFAYLCIAGCGAMLLASKRGQTPFTSKEGC